MARRGVGVLFEIGIGRCCRIKGRNSLGLEFELGMRRVLRSREQVRLVR